MWNQNLELPNSEGCLPCWKSRTACLTWSNRELSGLIGASLNWTGDRNRCGFYLPTKRRLTIPLDVTSLENWLWEAACTIRGPVDAPKFKDYILPLVFLKRLSDVFEDELMELHELTQ